jgi:hypothetical protein
MNSIIEENKDVLKIRFNTYYRDEGQDVGTVKLKSCDENGKLFETLFACSTITKNYVQRKIYNLMLKESCEVELTISIEPIDHTFIARLINNGFRLEDDNGKEIWGQYHGGIINWMKKYEYQGKEAYFFFEVL